jgi:hypothetical protein
MSERPRLDQPRPDEELGAYVGAGTVEDALEALEAHTPGDWVLILQDLDGEVEWVKKGRSWALAQDEEEAVFAVSLAEHEQSAGNPRIFVDVMVLNFVKSLPLDCDRYSGGLIVSFSGISEYARKTLTVIYRPAAATQPDTGDAPPGDSS